MEDTLIYQTINYSDVQQKEGFYITCSLNKHSVGGGVVYSQYNYVFTAYHPCEIIRCDYIYNVAGGAGGNTFYLEKVSGGTAVKVTDTALTFSASADTVYTLQKFRMYDAGTGKRLSNGIFKQGDSLRINASAHDTTLDGLNFTFYFKPVGKGNYR